VIRSKSGAGWLEAAMMVTETVLTMSIYGFDETPEWKKRK